MTAEAADALLGPAEDWPLCRLPADWAAALRPRLDLAVMARLRAALRARLMEGRRIFPTPERLFQALELTPLREVRAVILGQDPYHGAGQAHGLAFSVQPGMRLPSSLSNILRERNSDLGLVLPRDGFLVPWARQGVLLLNTVLTVEEAQAGSHRGLGWEVFTDAVVAAVNDLAGPVVFILWGKVAGDKAGFLHAERHLILRSVHPSGLSAHRGFFGSRPFSQVNDFLQRHGRGAIDWRSGGAD
ncbi:uracil-DNA glycosylase [Roseomonas elaeocarpi]|uniref:Uracil-DNA glycosylase n=1 Tax=Roseomonas elaeocarpi TaxID=907779 RepID=A0ABV6JTX1_9PROT